MVKICEFASLPVRLVGGSNILILMSGKRKRGRGLWYDVLGVTVSAVGILLIRVG